MKNKLNLNKKVAIVVLSLTILTVPVIVHSYKDYNYKKFYSIGQDALTNDNYNEAITNFKNALKYNGKKAGEVNNKLAVVEKIKNSKENYKKAEELLKNKRYLEAIESFKMVAKEDAKRYKNSEEKIAEAKKLYIAENMDKAKEEAKNSNYDAALSYLDYVLKVDSKDKEVIELKNEYNKEKENVSKAKAESATKNANDSGNGGNNAAGNNSNNVITPANDNSSGYPKVIQLNTGVHIIENKQQDDGHLGGIFIQSQHLTYALQPNGIYFTVAQMGTTTPIPYTAVFHLNGKDMVYNGTTSGEIRFINPSDEDLPVGYTAKVDFSATYKGKVYNFPNSFTRRY